MCGLDGFRNASRAYKGVYERLRLSAAPAAIVAAPAKAVATIAALEVSPVAASLPVVLTPVATVATVLIVFAPSDLEPSGLVSPGFSPGLASSGGAMTALLATASS